MLSLKPSIFFTKSPISSALAFSIMSDFFTDKGRTFVFSVPFDFLHNEMGFSLDSESDSESSLSTGHLRH